MKKITIIPPKTEEEVAQAEAQIVELSKRIEFYVTEYSVELLASKMDKGEFVVPSYQRDFTWEDNRKSRFIESLLLGLPIPFLFFWERSDGKLEIVDGSQRLRTIQAFLLGDFRVGDLESLTYLSGFRYSDLPESRRLKIKNRSIRGVILNEHADEQARLDMFDRINTGSKIANMAEVRRGALAGPFMNMIIDLANDRQFTALAPTPDKALKEREREELVTRFFAYSDGLKGYKDRPAEFIFNYVNEMNGQAKDDPALLKQYRDRFAEMLSFVKRAFPNGFRKSANGKTTPRARFEAIAIGSYLALSEHPALAKQQVDVSGWLDEKPFRDITGADGANAIARLKGRTEFVRDRLLSR